MSKKLYPETDIQNIANAIRNLNGSSDTYTVGQMASAIALPENGYYLKESTSANPLSITDGEELNAQSCEVSFEPIQDLNGYDSPWIDSDVINKEPYLMRAVSGTATRIGNSLYDTLVGGTVAFNQLVQNGNFASTTGWSPNNGISISATNNELTVSVDSDLSDLMRVQGSVPTTITNHIYLQKVDVKSSQANIMRMYCPADNVTPLFNITTTYSSCYHISKATRNATAIQPFRLNTLDAKPVGDTYTIKNCNFIDLTQMFGSTIADYIYSLEQATAGSGVAYFRSLFPKDYYDYNAGQLMSVKALSHKMVGFNQWDEQWESGRYSTTDGTKDSDTNRIRNKNKIKVIPNTSYYFNRPTSMTIYFYDAIENYLGYDTVSSISNLVTTPQNCHYICFNVGTSSTPVTTYNNNICINLHWDGERDGEYEAYEEHIYPLDSDLELRGIPKLDANNKLYYDGDTYESDGTVTRKYGIVDLGSLNWTYQYGSTGNPYFKTDSLPYVKSQTRQQINSIGYVPVSSMTQNTTDDKAICIYSSSNVRIRNRAYTDAETFTTAMSGVYLVYELATPTTETADTFENPQLVDNWGTEEYTDSRTIQIPVGHETYQANICEISGWNSLVLAQSGKNLVNWNVGKFSGGTGLVVTLLKGTYTLSQSVDVNTGNWYIKAQKSDFTYCSKDELGLSTWYDSSTTGVYYGASNAHSITFTIPENGVEVQVGTQTNPETDTPAQLEVGSVRTDYVPYVSYSTKTATFTNTYYGGKYDFASGKLVIDRIDFDMDTLPWVRDNTRYYFGFAKSEIGAKTGTTAEIISSCYPYSTVTTQDDTIYQTSTAIRINDATYISAQDLKNALTGQTMVVYLETPQEITLTPSQIALLENNNVLWSDSNGNVKLKYFSKSLS